jgi:hypothetical protein
MINHRLAHGALAAVYAATAAILFWEQTAAHAICTAAVALIYAGMAVPQRPPAP